MNHGKRWLLTAAGLAIGLVAVATIAASIRQGSWSPLISTSWLLGVIAATWPRARRRCLQRRRQAR